LDDLSFVLVELLIQFRLVGIQLLNESLFKLIEQRLEVGI